MKIKDLIEELEDKPFFKEFREENPKIFPHAAFFILDLKNETEQIQLDYYNPDSNKLEIFEFPFEKIKKQENKIPGLEEPTIDPNKITKLLTEPSINIDDLKDTSQDIIKENNVNIKPTKIIAILKDSQWNLTCMDDMLGIVRIKIDAKTKETIDFNKGSLMDFMGIKKGK